MTLVIDLPPDIEAAIRRSGADLERDAKEAMLVEWYRQERLTHSQLANALGLSRYELDGVLTRHGVEEDLITPEDLQEQLRAIGIDIQIQ